MSEKLKKHSFAERQVLYREAEEVDKDIFAEQRSNVLLVAGDHYQKRQANFFRRIRDSKDLSDEVKIRLTKNHIQKICRLYANNIVSLAPGVSVEPKNESELQDQKAAEINQAVWLDFKEKHDLDAKVDDWGDDFTTIGEVAVKIFFDPSEGKIKAYHQSVGDDGQPEVNADGSLMAGAPVHEGGFIFEPIFGFNLLRAPEAKEMGKSPYEIIRKMVDKDDLMGKWGHDPEKAKWIVESMDKTMMVFDGMKGGYSHANKQVLVKEFYFRPCSRYPKGYYFIDTESGCLAEGELPGGVFPIVYEAFDKIPTSPRGRSPVKVMRPYQVEINRAASKIAEHQITLGDDKLLIQNGTKISPGVALPGVRSINFTGMEPGILNGRDGSQYLAYMQAQIEELYRVMNVAEDNEPSKEGGQLDPYALLYRSATQKKKYSRYVRRFERFLKNVCWTSLELAKIHLSDDAVVYAAGRKERVNIPEFKNSEELCYQIKLTEQSDDIETKLGKQLVANHILQYTGNKMEKEDIGKLIRSMPYNNKEESFSDLTIDYDSATNLILALDRGDRPPIHEYDPFPYFIKRLTKRMRDSDFDFLDPSIQGNYTELVQTLMQLEADRQKKIQLGMSGYIPTAGYMVTVDLYVTDPTNPLKTRRARLPYDAIHWLIQKLEAQGQSLQDLEDMNQGAQAQLAEHMTQGGSGMGANGMANLPAPPQGAGMPGGVDHGTGSSAGGFG